MKKPVETREFYLYNLTILFPLMKELLLEFTSELIFSFKLIFL